MPRACERLHNASMKRPSKPSLKVPHHGGRNGTLGQQRLTCFGLFRSSNHPHCRSLQPSSHRCFKPVPPKGNQSWIFRERTNAETEMPILWPPDVKNWFIWKGPDAGKDWRWEEKGMTGWDAWMALPTQWTWVWVNSRSWWWTGRPGMLQSVGSQRVRHDWATELNCYCVKFEKWNMENGYGQIFLWSYEMGWFMEKE